MTIEFKIRKEKILQEKWALPLLAITTVVVLQLYTFNREAFFTTLFGLLFGYILQRSRFCFGAGFRDIFLIRNTTITRALLLTLLLTMAGFSLIYAVKDGAVRLLVYPVGIHTVAGGLIFGFGMVIAGNCVSGCLMRMGEGYLMQWVTFTGLLLGSAFGAWHLGWWDKVSIAHTPAVFLPDYLGWFFALLLQLALILLLYYLAYRYEGGRPPATTLRERVKVFSPLTIKTSLKNLLTARSWSYTAGAAALALTNTLLLYFWGRPWGITGGLTHLSGWLSAQAGLNPLQWHYFKDLLYFESNRFFLDHPLLYLAAAMVGGSFISSLLHNEFRIRRPRSWKFLASAMAGGTLMGYGSRAAIGCNIGGFLGGISSLSLHGWVFGLGILAGSYLGGKFFIRYLL